VNVLGGLGGGWAFERLWPMGQAVTGIGVAATAVGAFVGAVLLGDVAGLLLGMKKT